MTGNSFTVGSLVRARGREWVVLPESEDDMLMLRPLGGADDEVAGVYLPLEAVEPARFDFPDPGQVGDYHSARMLRDAVRLGFRSSAGPFRSFARLAFEPRSYQLVPLLMALKLDPVRLLIADDVGIGKTIEAGLIARELLDRGEINRLAVLCPPPLAEQWQAELRDKFHIKAELVLAGTAGRLERNLALDQSLFDLYPFVIVSTDYIKSDRRWEDFRRACPEMVIVDEAHTCSQKTERGGRHQRYRLLSALAGDQQRHLVLVTATPHSGKEEAFRSLLTLLRPSFADLPEDLTGKENEKQRRKLAEHFVQRRRADIRRFMDENTPFPERDEAELTYKLSTEYRQLFDRALDYTREVVKDQSGGQFQQRVRWWSALALLRALASSPEAAAATLRNRAASADTQSAEDADEIGRRTVLDLVEDEPSEGVDVIPGSDSGGEESEAKRNHNRLLDMARQSEALRGDKDSKLLGMVKIVKDLLNEDFHPILFCRFIPTAEYLARELRQRLPKNVEVVAVTGNLPPAEREVRVQQMVESPRRVLVATDCLSEGINLQDLFDAVVHYDLSWNPTRHEQREGRVDRYGQPKARVRALTYFGADNQVDGIVLDVLIRKHRTIRSSLGISVPVPIDSDEVIEAIFEGLLLRESASVSAQLLPGMEEYLKPHKDDLFARWESVTEREKRSRTLFAQETIKGEVVAQELAETRAAVGSGVALADFTGQALRALNAQTGGHDPLRIDLRTTPLGLQDLLLEGRPDAPRAFEACFELPVGEKQVLLTRTHPFIEKLASYVMETALDPQAAFGEDDARLVPARRCGAIRTAGVDARTTLLLLRFRFHIIAVQKGEEVPLLAEEMLVMAYRGAPEDAQWLGPGEAEALLASEPEANIHPQQAGNFVRKVIDGYGALLPHLEETAQQRAAQLLESHQRVRQAAKVRGLRHRVEPQLPPDVLGIYVYLPSEK